MGKDQHETVYVGARVPVPLAAAFERIASSEDRTISAELRRLIRRRVEEAAHSAADQSTIQGAKAA